MIGRKRGDKPQIIEDVYAGLSRDESPILTAVMISPDAQRFDSERQFEDLLDADVRGLETRIGDRG